MCGNALCQTSTVCWTEWTNKKNPVGSSIWETVKGAATITFTGTNATSSATSTSQCVYVNGVCTNPGSSGSQFQTPYYNSQTLGQTGSTIACINNICPTTGQQCFTGYCTSTNNNFLGGGIIACINNICPPTGQQCFTGYCTSTNLNNNVLGGGTIACINNICPTTGQQCFTGFCTSTTSTYNPCTFLNGICTYSGSNLYTSPINTGQCTFLNGQCYNTGTSNLNNFGSGQYTCVNGYCTPTNGGINGGLGSPIFASTSYSFTPSSCAPGTVIGQVYASNAQSYQLINSGGSAFGSSGQFFVSQFGQVFASTYVPGGTYYLTISALGFTGISGATATVIITCNGPSNGIGGIGTTIACINNICPTTGQQCFTGFCTSSTGIGTTIACVNNICPTTGQQCFTGYCTSNSVGSRNSIYDISCYVQGQYVCGNFGK
ncbi:hypothetical protein RvY_08323 [Ramazzottius varieornatus]|uniref:Uncharacterized protein n=1 Tax=Ramazzottius varieornatus TaxID=947166 RepID=A0A1D1V5F0_RAMVA|nr:hypothetical protein RvY_08323 [Ramazzottius varieornatus]